MSEKGVQLGFASVTKFVIGSKMWKQSAGIVLLLIGFSCSLFVPCCVQNCENLSEWRKPDTLSWRPPHTAPHRQTRTRRVSQLLPAPAATPVDGRCVFLTAVSPQSLCICLWACC